MKYNDCEILIVGSLPPPVGGVTIFLKYFTKALSFSGVKYRFLSHGCFLNFRKSIVHINASNSLKRFFFILFFKCFFKKVYFVKHGGPFNLKNIFVKCSLRIADGVFCLNEEVQSQLKPIGVRTMLHTTVFEENALELKRKYHVVDNKKTDGILFYINNNDILSGEEVYGANFFANAIREIPPTIKITVVDLSNSYAKLFSEFDNVKYISQAVDFCDLLSKHKVYVRCTSTDGQSVALLEAGLLGVKCLASDVVTRPNFVKTYKHGNTFDFLESLNDLTANCDEENLLNLTSVRDVVSFMCGEAV